MMTHGAQESALLVQGLSLADNVPSSNRTQQTLDEAIRALSQAAAAPAGLSVKRIVFKL